MFEAGALAMRSTIATVFAATLTIAVSPKNSWRDRVRRLPPFQILIARSPTEPDLARRKGARPKLTKRDSWCVCLESNWMTVADIGAGSGYHVVRLSPIVGPHGRVIAEDIVPEYLRACAVGCATSDCET